MEGISTEYFKEFRKLLGFSSQSKARQFFKAGDVIPSIDYTYLTGLNRRLASIITRLNTVVDANIRYDDAELQSFIDKYITQSYELLHANNIMPRLNNQGRRPEEVYYSWMRGFVMMHYFSRSIAHMFNLPQSAVTISGDDDLNSIETFKRTPSADLELATSFGIVRLEIQSGFTGINDIKQHKVLEARRLADASNTMTLVIHFDIYNGQVAIVRIDTINDNDLNWITRQQMEGQTVFTIDQNHFCWKLIDPAPSLATLKELIYGE